MSDPLPVTVVVPAYNAETYVAAALASVRAQTRQPADVICVDDGSSDRTAAVARTFGVRVIVQENAGVARARNVAIGAATTPWIALLDADDVWLPDRLERQWAAREANPEALAIATDYALLVDDRVTVGAVLATIERYRALPRLKRPGDCVWIARAALTHAIVRGNFVLPSSLLLDRRVFSDYGAYFASRTDLPDGGDEYFVGEDFEWILRVLRFADLLVVERPLVRYRRSAASLSADGGKLRYGDMKLGELVCAMPDRYAVGAAEAFAALKATVLFESAMRYLRDGKLARSRALFGLAAGAGHVRARAAAAALAPLDHAPGRRAFVALVALWRARIRPLVRPGTR